VKNQYFADKRDFYKYDLLLELMRSSRRYQQLLLVWWLTPDDPPRPDKRQDGAMRAYLCGERDEALYEWLDEQHSPELRDVRRLALCPRFKEAGWRYLPLEQMVPVDSEERTGYVANAAASIRPHSLIFLDPDNGMMVPSAKGNRRRKYVDYTEVQALVEVMDETSLLLIYQHLPRQKRTVFYPERLRRLCANAGVEHATWISPDNDVAFWLIATSNASLRVSSHALADYLERHEFRVPEQGVK
jgi:hypothetical protein